MTSTPTSTTESNGEPTMNEITTSKTSTRDGGHAYVVLIDGTPYGVAYRDGRRWTSVPFTGHASTGHQTLTGASQSVRGVVAVYSGSTARAALADATPTSEPTETPNVAQTPVQTDDAPLPPFPTSPAARVRVFDAARLAITEIADDIAERRTPDTVSEFGELHDYADANEYGGLCDDAMNADLDNDAAWWVQDIAHRWLSARKLDDRALLVAVMRADRALSDDGSPSAESEAHALFAEADRRWGADALERSAEFFTGHKSDADDIVRMAEENAPRLFEVMGCEPTEWRAGR